MTNPDVATTSKSRDIPFVVRDFRDLLARAKNPRFGLITRSALAIVRMTGPMGSTDEPRSLEVQTMSYRHSLELAAFGRMRAAR